MRKKKKSGVFIKAAVLVFILYAVVSLIALQGKINREKEKAVLLREQIEDQTVLGARYREVIDSELSPEEAARLARKMLGFAFPGETVIVDTSK
ncbi:MAG: hypothetical protein LBR85_04900 [Oscillospiraceae bacterium]|nr:hypothetical protein [Oscillospiraceae bacterium]